MVSKLLYGLEVYCLKAYEKQRVDGLHVACLRKILRIPHSMISHVTNKTVLQTAREKPLSKKILVRQITLFGCIASLRDDSLMRTTIFNPGSCVPKLFEGKRCRGRPPITWSSALSAQALQVAGGNMDKLKDLLTSQQTWKLAVKQHFQ